MPHFQPYIRALGDNAMRQANLLILRLQPRGTGRPGPVVGALRERLFNRRFGSKPGPRQASTARSGFLGADNRVIGTTQPRTLVYPITVYWLEGSEVSWWSRPVWGMLLGCTLIACGSDDEDVPIPVPDSFQAYFVSGQVCMPTNIRTGTSPGSGPEYPVRFDICTHRCITLARGSSAIRTSFLCAAGQCSMVMLGTAPATRVQAEKNCDGRELLDPPQGSCSPESFTFSLSPPAFQDGSYIEGDMVVSVPFMNLEQAEQVSKRVEAGENAQQVIAEVVGAPPADRQWIVNYDPAHPVVSDGSSLSGAECHPIAAP